MTAKEFNDLVKESGKYGDHARASYLMGLAAGAADGGWEMLQKAAAYAEELERRKKAEAQRDKARAELGKARKQNKANSRSATAAEAVRDDCRRQLEAERAKRKELEAEVNRLKARVLDLLDKATA